MKKVLAGAGCLILFLFILGSGEALAQNTVANADFELQDYGLWVKTGQNQGAEFVQYDTNGNGQRSWCLKRKPGTGFPFGCNGGPAQDVILIGGVTYNFFARICYIATC